MRTRLLALALLAAGALSALAGSHDKFSYIYAKGDGRSTISSGSLDDILKVAKRYNGTYLWFRQNGREYLVRDAATLAEVRNAFAEVEALEPEEHAIEERMRPYEKKMDALEKKMDQLSDSMDDEELAESVQRDYEDRMHDMEQEMEGLERQMEGIQREQERIEREMERRETIAERHLEEILTRAVTQGRAESVK